MCGGGGKNVVELRVVIGGKGAGRGGWVLCCDQLTWQLFLLSRDVFTGVSDLCSQRQHSLELSASWQGCVYGMGRVCQCFCHARHGEFGDNDQHMRSGGEEGGLV